MLTYEFIEPETQLKSDDFEIIESFLLKARMHPIGWHYITDLIWIYSNAKHWPRSYKVLDAGGGSGPVQFLLAEMGFEVTNIDMALVEPSVAFSDRYKMTKRVLPSFNPTPYKEFLDSVYRTKKSGRSITDGILESIKKTGIYRKIRANNYSRRHDQWRNGTELRTEPVGTIRWIVGNLCSVPEIESNTFDAVVSLSAWEHIPTDVLDAALKEIRRIVKPDAKWAVTTSGTDRAETWWHDPSQSYAFSNEDLVTRFAAQPFSNQDPKTVLDEYRNCKYLRENLASFYKGSGTNGMPWGKWDPQYIPIGLKQ